MTDDQVWETLIALLTPLFIAETGLTDAVIQQAQQPTQQSAPDPEFITMHRIHSRRYGWTEKKSQYNLGNNNFDAVDTQLIEATFQAQAFKTINPSVSSLTPYDMALVLAGIMQLDATLDSLRTSGLNIYRITDVRVPYFVDDRQRVEQTPSFDFTLVHERAITSTVPVVEAQELDINRV